MDPFIVIRWMSLVISMLCLFQVTANGSRSVELKDGDYLIFNMETMPQSIKPLTFISLSTYFFLVIYLIICLKAMIAFISETFADIFDDKIAVIARERRLMLSWTSCGMGDAKIELSSISSIIVLVPVLVSTTHHSIITTYHVYDDVYQFLKVKS